MRIYTRRMTRHGLVALIALSLAGCGTTAVTTTPTITTSTTRRVAVKIASRSTKRPVRTDHVASVRHALPGIGTVDQAHPRPPCPSSDAVSGATGNVYCIVATTQPCPNGFTPSGQACGSNTVTAACRMVISKTGPSYFDCSGAPADAVAKASGTSNCPTGYLPDWGSSSVNPTCVSLAVDNGCRSIILPDGQSGSDQSYCDKPH
jgi:hypothetical protein